MNDSVHECKYLTHCPIWERFQSSEKHVWIKNYCKGEKQSHCKRKEIVDMGEKAPLELLPDGTLLPKSSLS